MNFAKKDNYRFLFHGLQPFLQITAVINGRKKATRIEKLEDKEFWGKYCQKIDLKTYRYKTEVGDYLFVSRKYKYIQKAIECHESTETNNNELGELFGFPKCCIDHFSSRQYLNSPDKDAKLAIEAIQKSKLKIYPFYLNDWTGDFIFHHPCSYDCIKTAKIGKENALIAKRNSKKIYKKYSEKAQICLIALGAKVFSLKKPEFSFNDTVIEIPFPARLPYEDFKKFEKKNHYEIGFKRRSRIGLVFEQVKI